MMDVPNEIAVPEEDSLKETILKTANYVKQNGPEFEKKLVNDERFAFTNPNNVYYEYFKFILKHNVNEDPIPTEPYSFSFSNYDKNLSPRDLEIIKTTAMFCVSNKDLNYLDKMRHQFGSNPQFSFLSPNHSLNRTFVQFINQYKQIKNGTVIPPSFDHSKENYKSLILRRSFQRAVYNEYSGEVESERNELSRIQKIQFAAYDWTNFQVAHKIELTDTDNEPLDFVELSRRRIDSTYDIPLFRDNNSLEATTKNKKRKVKAAGETRIKRKKAANSTKEIQCPLTRKMIPEDKFDKHLQILLGDPDFKTEREKYKIKHQLTNLSFDQVFENIKKIAKNSPDF